MSDGEFGEFGGGRDGPVTKQSVAHGQDLQFIWKAFEVKRRLRDRAIGDATAECRGDCNLSRWIAGKRGAGGVQENLVNRRQGMKRVEEADELRSYAIAHRALNEVHQQHFGRYPWLGRASGHRFRPALWIPSPRSAASAKR